MEVVYYSDNFICYFSIIKGDWFNDKDEYLAPNENHEKFNEFVNDSVIYSLFHSSSNQSSLRQVEYKGKKWDIKNEFFWMSKNDIINLANEYGLEVYQDAPLMNVMYITIFKNIRMNFQKKH